MLEISRILVFLNLTIMSGENNQCMRLRQDVLQKINKPKIRLRLMQVLGVVERTINRHIATNSAELTKASALKVIREETGLTDEQILTEAEPEREKAIA